MLQIGEMKMSKAAKFDEFLSSNNINCFSKEEIDNEMHSIVYRAHMEVSSQNLPTMIVLDDSIYTMIQVRVAAGVVNAGNREGVLMHINELNKKYKVFKSVSYTHLTLPTTERV